jgi:hypothetical protein
MKRQPEALLAAYALAILLAMIAVLLIASLPALDLFFEASLTLEDEWPAKSPG